jgi:hypothetical protein
MRGAIPRSLLRLYAAMLTEAQGQLLPLNIKWRDVFCNHFHASHWITRLEVSALVVSVNFMFVKIIERDESIISHSSGLWTMEMIHYHGNNRPITKQGGLCEKR